MRCAETQQGARLQLKQPHRAKYYEPNFSIYFVMRRCSRPNFARSTSRLCCSPPVIALLLLLAKASHRPSVGPSHFYSSCERGFGLEKYYSVGSRVGGQCGWDAHYDPMHGIIVGYYVNSPFRFLAHASKLTFCQRARGGLGLIAVIKRK